jgi:predicted nucleotidyltransferase
MKVALPDRAEIIQCIREVAIQLGAQKAILFGSFARGTETKRSDIDVVFVEDTEDEFLDRIGRYLGLLRNRETLKVFDIDVLVYTPEEIERMLSEGNRFIRRVLKEGLTVYES